MVDTVTVTKNYIPQIDYLSKDYTAILADLTAIAKQFNPGWSVSDPSDIGVALLETFAYLGDILSFYTDRMASEGFLGTASQRSSILQIASMLGYTPTPSTAATVSLNIKNNNASGTMVIPAGTQIASSTVVNGQSTQVIFELDNEVSVGFGATVAATATQGSTVANESLGTSNGTPSQYFKLAQTGVIINTSGSNIQVSVGGSVYTYTSSLVDSTAYDSVFTTTMDADGYTYIVFGDGVSGRIPPATYTVTATYRVGVGSKGNIPLGSLATTFASASLNATITQTSAASGGTDEESTDSIRINAPRALRTLRRAVSLKDYAYLALQVSGVSKSSADSSVWSSVNLYIAPFGSSAVNIYGPYTGITAVTKSASDGTAYSAGTAYLKYAAANGTFSGLVAGTSYVTISGAAAADYDLEVPTLVRYVDPAGAFFTVVSPITTYPTYSSTASNTVVKGVGANTAAFNSLKTEVANYFIDKVAPNVTLTILPPVYVPINLDVAVRVLPQYSQSAVVTQVQNALSSLVSYNNAFFADRITPHLILNSVSNIDGVDYASVDHLRRGSNEQKFFVQSWSRPTTTSVTLTLANPHTIVAGQTIKVNGVWSSIDGTYVVQSVNAASPSTITIAVPATSSVPSYTASTNISPGGTTISLSSTVGLVVGMTIGCNTSNVFGNGVNTTTITNVGTSTIGVAATINNTITTGTAITLLSSSEDSYARVLSVDSEIADGVLTPGIICDVDEVPTKNVFNISASGGLS